MHHCDAESGDQVIKLHRIGLLVLSALLSCSCGIFSSPATPNHKGDVIKEKICQPAFLALFEVAHNENLALCSNNDCINAENISYAVMVASIEAVCIEPIKAVATCSPRCDLASGVVGHE